MNLILCSTCSPNCHSRRFFAFMLLLALLIGAFPKPTQPVHAAPASPAYSSQWLVVDNMSTRRAYHTLSVLSDGRAMAIGGFYNDGSDHYLNSTEAFDPVRNRWSNLASMSEYRRNHTATVLLDGRVLVIGGQDATQSHNSAELYTPNTDSWAAATNTMAVSRYRHTATRLYDGKVLIVGGCSGDFSCTSAAEVFDPNTLTFSSAGSLSSGARYGHVAVLLDNGKVLVAGGYNPSAGGGTYRSSAEIYDPVANLWTSTGSMSKARLDASAALLPDNTVLVAGGFRSTIIGDETLSSTEIYDPANGSWSDADPLNTPRRGHSQVVRYHGGIWVLGGYTGSSNTNQTEVLSVEESYHWADTIPLNQARSRFPTVILPTGAMLVAGGLDDSTYLDSAEILKVFYDSFGSNGQIYGYTAHRATLLPNGNILVAGGRKYPGFIFEKTTKIWHPDTKQYTMAAPMNLGRENFTLTLLSDGRVLATGGTWKYDEGLLPTDSAEIYDPEADTWIPTAGKMNNPHSSHLATLLPDGRVLVIADGYMAEIFDPRTGRFTITAENSPLDNPNTATLLPNGEVLVVGGPSGANCALYNPQTGDWDFTQSLPFYIEMQTATLLPDGTVLLVGGETETTPMSIAYLYDYRSNTWSATGFLNEVRALHTAILLPDGYVVVVGGRSWGLENESVEIYSPLTKSWEVLIPSLHVGSREAVFTLSGDVLVIPGDTQNLLLEIYNSIYDLHPVIDTITLYPNLAWEWTFRIVGSRFFGRGEGSSGGTQNAAGNQPLVQLRRLDNDQITWLAPTTSISKGLFTSLPLSGFPAGPVMITVFTSGGMASKIVIQPPLNAVFMPLIKK